MSVVWRDEEARELFRVAELETLEQFAEAETGEIVDRSRTRRLARLPLGERVFWIKVQDLRRARLHPSRWPSYAFRGSPIKREAKALTTLRQHGFRTPELIASGAARGLVMPKLAVLITEEVAGHTDLVHWLADRPKNAGAALDAADELVRRVHERGLVLLGAKYRNILIPTHGTDDASMLTLLDQPDLRASSSRRLRDKDRRLMRHDRERYGAAG
ncbi:MAG: lipopolysaccharide kinase InaA family protein [Planctomycetota bacterium]|jgi:hypothetical protein|nr:lipopolysaccharide kinase InaA family protein [Planctomycetota bacterium]